MQSEKASCKAVGVEWPYFVKVSNRCLNKHGWKFYLQYLVKSDRTKQKVT